MTETQIKEQILVIKQATAEASKSKETARKFLMDAGIIKRTSVQTAKSQTKS